MHLFNSFDVSNKIRYTFLLDFVWVGWDFSEKYKYHVSIHSTSFFVFGVLFNDIFGTETIKH
jgi:hypothetical protein